MVRLGRDSFDAPPFVVWRIVKKDRKINGRSLPYLRDRDETDAKYREPDSEYRLIPHNVYRHLIINSVFQSVAFGIVVWLRTRAAASVCECRDATGFSQLLAHCPSIPVDVSLAVGCFVIFCFLTVVASSIIQMSLKLKSLQPVKQLLLLSSGQARKEFESVFPTTDERRESDSGGTSRLNRKQDRSRGKPTLVETIYWLRRFFVWNEATSLTGRISLIIHGKFYRFVPRRFSNKLTSLNLAKLSALELRQEDSCLHALSAYAIVSYFISVKKERSRAETQIAFLLSYFSPVLYGFALCVIIFATYIIMPSNHYAYMISIFFWFAHSLFYAYTTLRQDFARQFGNYFDSRVFPRDMTSFANRQMSLAPDLVELAQSKWLSTVVTVGIVGLASLYAAFLQSLTS